MKGHSAVFRGGFSTLFRSSTHSIVQSRRTVLLTLSAFSPVGPQEKIHVGQRDSNKGLRYRVWGHEIKSLHRGDWHYNTNCIALEHVIFPLSVPSATTLAQLVGDGPPLPLVHRPVKLRRQLDSASWT